MQTTKSAAVPANPRLSTPELMNEYEVARHLSVSPETVRKWRQLKKGPPAIKVGACVRYRRADVDAWLDSRPEIGGTTEGV